MADIQLIQIKNQQNIVPYKEIGVRESNGDVRILTGVYKSRFCA